MKTWMLCPLERSCLRWASKGRSLTEIALLEGKSVDEIEQRLRSAVAFMAAKSLEEATESTHLEVPTD